MSLAAALSPPLLTADLPGLGGRIKAELDDFDSIVVETDVPEARLHVVKAGSPAEIVLDAYPDRLAQEVLRLRRPEPGQAVSVTAFRAEARR